MCQVLSCDYCGESIIGIGKLNYLYFEVWE